jgi:quercetin dioxygenase-like cupin family protein
MKKNLVVGLAVAASIATAAGGVALATAGVGAVGEIKATGSFVDRVDVKFKINEVTTDVIHVSNAQNVVMQQIAIAASGHTGWHSHHGPAVVLVKSGTLTLYSADDPTCAGRTYVAGDAFVDSGQGHRHIGRNLSPTQGTELWVTYFDVPVGASVRIDVPDPGTCTF